MKRRTFNSRNKLTVPILLLILVGAIFGCYDRSEFAGRHRPDDKILQPFAAMYEIDREQHCLTEIDPDSTVHVERENHEDYGYDILLHIEGDRIYRTVAFVWEHDKYVWIGEQESHRSGRTYMTPDGEWDEYIVVAYHERAIRSGPAGLLIDYSGPYEDISARPTCEDALRIIRRWHTEEAIPDGG